MTTGIGAASILGADELPAWRRPLHRATAVVALAVVALNLVDAFATLHHVSLGAEEVNPLMRLLLAHGPLPFFVGKHVLACSGVLGIAAHCHVPIARALLKMVLLPVYVAIVAYQLALFVVV